MSDTKSNLGLDEPVQFKKGQVLFVEGASTSYVYLIISGRVGAFSEGDGGRLSLISVHSDKEFLGESSLFNDANLVSTAIALEDSTIYMLKKTDMRKVISQCPEWVTDILVTLCDRLNHSTSDLKEHRIVATDEEDYNFDPSEEGALRKAVADYRKGRGLKA
jgi:CRP-like cAMP-binding protein